MYVFASSLTKGFDPVQPLVSEDDVLLKCPIAALPGITI